MTIRLPLLAAALAALLAWVMPLGEAPDELAHLRYAESLAAGRLPVLAARGAEGYEAHQPPLGYLLPAMVIATAGGIDVRPLANPSLDFHRAGSRAFVPPFAGERDRLVLRLARTTQVVWTALAVWAGLRLGGGSRWATPFLLAPQLLVVGAALNNDAALVALASCALLMLVRFVETGHGAVASGLLVVAALFVKGSALFLLVPVGVAVALAPPFTTAARRIAPSPRFVLLAITAAGVSAWLAFNLARFGTVLPPIPTARHVATAWELVAEPRWLGGLFRSFWAKFGWLNTPMPWPFYLWFAAASLLAVVGALRSRGAASRVLLAAVVANFGLVVAFLLTVDLQPQGRYLLPSLTAIAALATVAVPASRARRLERAAEPAAVVVALAAVATIAVAYR